MPKISPKTTSAQSNYNLMSHTVAIKTEFKNWNVLQKTLNRLGWTIKENTKCRTYPSDPDRNKIHPIAAINPMSSGYDMGVKLNEDGSIEFLWDSYGGSIEKSLGKGFSTLKKEYIVDLTREYYEEVELMELLADGSIILEADDGL